MWQELGFQLLFMGGIATFVGAVWWGLLRLMDWAGNVKFKDAISHISTDRQALAIYFSARLIATAILFEGLIRLVF